MKKKNIVIGILVLIVILISALGTVKSIGLGNSAMYGTTTTMAFWSKQEYSVMAEKSMNEMKRILV